MMTEAVINELNKQELTKMHEDLLSKVRGLVDMSRKSMSSFYPEWDKRAETYKAFKALTKNDAKAAADNAPTSMALPLTQAQVNTAVAFMFLIYNQREKFYELNPQGLEDESIRYITESILERDLRANKFDIILFKTLVNQFVFGLSIIKSGWSVEKMHVLTPGQVLENTIDKHTADYFQEVTTFEGNRIYSISPYNFFPDTRVNLQDWEDGEFCASESEFTKTRLREQAASGMVAGVDHIEWFDDKSRTARRDSSRFKNINFEKNGSDDMVCVTEVQIKLVPKDFILSDGNPLGPQEFPISYIVWMANDNRIIRLEPSNYYHGKFNYDVNFFTYDDQVKLGQSLVGVVDKLQETIDWFINTRVSSVHRTLDNQLVVDPTAVDMASINSRSRVITLKKGAPRVGIDRFIRPLPVQDVTGGHIQDAEKLAQLMQVVTGVNDNALGQYNRGRRSATEARAATQGGASRLTMLTQLGWTGCFAPLGQKLATNTRQSLSQETFNLIVGDDPEKQSLYQPFKGSWQALVQQVDFFVYDGTLPSEKQWAAQSLQEILSLALQNPQAALMLGIDVKKLFDEIYTLRGIKNLKRFSPDQPDQQMDPQQIMMLMQQMQSQPQAPTAV